MAPRTQPRSSGPVLQRPDGEGPTALVKLRRSLLTHDAPSGHQKPPRIGRAERMFNQYLWQIAGHVGKMVEGFPPGDVEKLPWLTQLLAAYADALTPWAVSMSRRMLEEVNARDIDSWHSLSGAISRQLRRDIRKTDVGETMRELLHRQVKLIRSLPLEAGERVHELTLKGLENSVRAKEYAAEIFRTGEVTKSRATLIARTETARTASILTQARATSAGITHYRWQTAKDQDVRPGHKAMQGKVCAFNKPPAVNENGRIMHHHPGEIWNCRCWPEPIVELEE